MSNSLKKNFIFNSIYSVSAFIFPLITYPYISRVVQPSGVGAVSFATTFISYFNMFAQLGIPTYGIKQVAKVRDSQEELNRTVKEIFSINIITTVIAYVFLVISLLCIEKIRSDRVLIAIISTTILLNTVGMEWLYKGIEKYQYIATRSLIFKVFSVFGLFMLVHSPEDYLIYGFISIFASSASNILNFYNLNKYVSFKNVKARDYKRHLKPIMVFFAMTIATTIYTSIDTIMIKFMQSKLEVGYYDAAIKVKTVLVTFITSLGAVILPRSSYYVENDKMNDFNILINKSINFVLIMSLSLMVYFIIFANETIMVLSGNLYSKSVFPMQVIMPTLLFIGLSNLTGIQVLIPLNKEKYVLYSEILGAIVNVLTNCLLIPRLGIVGAAVGTTLAEFTVLLYQIACIRLLKIEINNKCDILKILLSILVSSLIVIFIRNTLTTSHNILIIAITGVVYFFCYFIMLFILKHPFIISMFKDILRKFK